VWRNSSQSDNRLALRANQTRAREQIELAAEAPTVGASVPTSRHHEPEFAPACRSFKTAG
jgi:hypothetical protein